MKKSLQEYIIKYLASHNEWRSKGFITESLKWKYVEKGVTKTAMADTISRKLRLSEEESRIAVRPAGKSVEYRFLPPEHRARYIPFSFRERGKESILFKS